MSNTNKSRNGLTFARQVPAAEDDRLVYEMQRPATVEAVGARIYPGAENTLRLNIKHIPASGSPVDLVHNADAGAGKSYIDGEDDHYQWNVSHPVEKDDLLVVDHNNTDGSNAHNYRVNMDLDYHGGARRAVGRLQDLVADVAGGLI